MSRMTVPDLKAMRPLGFFRDSRLESAPVDMFFQH
jgi:hypothetical protein